MKNDKDDNSFLFRQVPDDHPIYRAGTVFLTTISRSAPRPAVDAEPDIIEPVPDREESTLSSADELIEDFEDEPST